MEVSVMGWGKNHGTKYLCASKVQPKEGPVPIHLGEATAHPHMDRHIGCRHEVTIQFGAENVSLNGNYFGKVTLTEIEVAMLFCMVLEKRSFSAGQELISEAAKMLRRAEVADRKSSAS
ncbi:hypothetical protein [Brevundimonas sp. TWP2-3-4b1]|uniref:hypothetical protein n=1 Tax=Brevundimonas sp. TWP2-3-4b1 TaxID=2804580 RepID=UPI003CF4D5A3